MYCRNCRHYMEEEYAFCPQCGTPVKQPQPSLIGKVLFFASIASVIISLIAFVEVIMFIGVTLGGITLAGSIIVYFQNKTTPRIEYTIALSVVGVLSNLSWLLFLWYVLPTLM